MSRVEEWKRMSFRAEFHQKMPNEGPPILFRGHTYYFVIREGIGGREQPIKDAVLRFFFLNLPEYITVWACWSFAEAELVKIFF